MLGGNLGSLLYGDVPVMILHRSVIVMFINFREQLKVKDADKPSFSVPVVADYFVHREG